MDPQPQLLPSPPEKEQHNNWWRDISRLVLTALGILYTYRAVLLLGAIITLIAVGRDSSMVSGLFALNASDQYWLSFVVTLVGTQIFVITRILLMHVPARLGFDSKVVGPQLLWRVPSALQKLWIVVHCRTILGWLWVLLVSVAPVAFFQYRLYTLSNGNWWSIFTGNNAALLVFFVCVVVANALAEPNSAQVLPLPILRDKPFSSAWSRSVGKRLSHFFCRVITNIDDAGEGFIHEGKILPGHFLALFGTGTLVALYVGAGWAEKYVPSWHFSPGDVKGVFYALLTIALCGSALAFLCFVFDRHRIPIITFMVVVAFLLSLLPRHVHYYQIVADPHTLPVKADALWNGSNDRVIVISAQGGGIQAAAWTTRVLLGIVQQMPDRLRPTFVKSVRLTSSVSGGSVGAMFYQTLYSNPSALDAPLQHMNKVHAAGVCGTALSWIGFGIAYYDLIRPVVMLSGYDLQDRGWGAEQAWRKLLQTGLSSQGDLTLHQLRRGVADGTRPLMVFNATIADLGDPLVIANFDLAKDRDFKAFQNLYEDSDLKLTTAVRLSAAFPYVSPSPRPYRDGAPVRRNGFAITDGGLYDNFGVAGAYFTLQQATNYFTQTAPKPIMWIQIRLPAAPDQEADLLSGTALGPLLTLNNTRVTGQRSRADQLTDLAKNQLGDQLQVNKFDYPYFNAPLSWALNTAQISSIDDGWRNLVKGREQVSHVCDFLGGSELECAQAASPWATLPGSLERASLSSPPQPDVCPEERPQ